MMRPLRSRHRLCSFPYEGVAMKDAGDVSSKTCRRDVQEAYAMPEECSKNIVQNYKVAEKPLCQATFG
jgi:hypothetical protein